MDLHAAEHDRLKARAAAPVELKPRHLDRETRVERGHPTDRRRLAIRIALAEEHVIDTVRIDRNLVKGGREVFGLRVHGDSMIDAGILNGDYIFVKKQITAQRGDIVVALIAEEATVKYYFPEKDYIRFQPANHAMAPILVRAMDFRPTMLLGVVVGIFRRI